MSRSLRFGRRPASWALCITSPMGLAGSGWLVSSWELSVTNPKGLGLVRVVGVVGRWVGSNLTPWLSHWWWGCCPSGGHGYPRRLKEVRFTWMLHIFKRVLHWCMSRASLVMGQESPPDSELNQSLEICPGQMGSTGGIHPACRARGTAGGGCQVPTPQSITAIRITSACHATSGEVLWLHPN
jgi:hypothetical protein